MRKLKTYIVFFLLITLVKLSFSQKYTFKSFSIKEGLPQSQVYAMAQDSNHFLWVGTLNGLSRFDGKKFTNYFVEDGLFSNEIKYLISDKKRVWVGTSNGLNFIEDDKVYILENERLINSNINFLSKEDDQLLVVFNDYEILKIDSSGNERFYFSIDKNEYRERVIKGAIQIAGKLVLATKSGVYFLDENNQLIPIDIFSNNLNVNKIKKLGGDVYISTVSSGIFHLGVSNNKELFVKKNYLINPTIRGFTVDRQNSIWLVAKSGVIKISERDTTYFDEASGANFIPEDILQDVEGNIWINTEGKGIVQLVSEHISYLNKNQGLASDLILSFVEDGKSMWFITYGEGINRWVNNRFERYNTTTSIINNTLWCSIKTHDGSVWFGSSDGVSRFLNNSFENYTLSSFFNGRKVVVQSFFEDQEKVLWIGTKKGLFSFKNNKFELKNQFIKKIRSITSFGEDKLLLGTDKGVLVYNKLNDSFIPLSDKLNEVTVFTIAKNGSILYFATDEGLYTFSKGILHKQTVSSNLKNDETLNFVFVDSRQSVWVGTTSAGVFIKRKEDSVYRQYTVNEGLVGMETNMNAIYEDSRGKVWIGTSEGVSIFDPAKENELAPIKPKINLSSINLFYKKQNLLDSNKTTFRYNENNLTFYYNTPFFSNNDQVRYSYFLEGNDEYWSPLDETDFVRYSNLPHGSYTFNVKSTTNGSNWSDVASYAFTIKPPFWLTWWFRILFLVLVFLIVYYFFNRQKIRQSEKRQRDLLEYKNKLIKLEQQSLNASMNRHFIFNALNSIQFYINKEDKLAANKYLSSFAKLIRKNLDSSSQEDSLISLNEEIERLELYLSLEKMRFKDQFNYAITIGKGINLEETKVPGMFLQPFVENSIWHGILPTKSEGLIELIIEKINKDGLKFTIQDNGIGIDVSKANKKNELVSHNSKGVLITNSRIALLEKITGKSITITGPYQIEEGGEVKGTRVEIVFK